MHPKQTVVQYKLRLGDDSPWQASEVPLSNAQLVSVADPETVCLSYASGRRQAECNRGRQHLRLRSTYLGEERTRPQAGQSRCQAGTHTAAAHFPAHRHA